MENEFSAVIRNFPSLCQGRNDLQTVVDLNQGIEKLVGRPHRRLRFGEGGIQGSDAIIFIVMKDLSAFFLPVIAGYQEEQDQAEEPVIIFGM